MLKSPQTHDNFIWVVHCTVPDKFNLKTHVDYLFHEIAFCV